MAMFGTNFAVDWLNTFLWPFLRIGAMLLSAPLFGASSVSVQARILFSVALTWLVMPLLPDLPQVSPLTPDGLLIAVHQIVIGVLMGFVLHLVFGAAVLMGQSLGMSMGLGFAMAIDPQNGTQVPVVSQFFLILATLIFLSMNGHVILISILLDSFNTYPVGLSAWSSNTLLTVALWTSRMFASGLLMALPVMTAVLLVNLSLGVITRSAPQLNIFSVGFPIAILVGLVMLILVLPVFLQQLLAFFAEAFELMKSLLDPQPGT